MNSNVTFVTSFFKIYDEDYDISRRFEKRLELFLKIVHTGINICIFVSPEFEKIFIELEQKYSNMKLLKTYEKSDLKFSSKYFPEAESCQFPYYRNEVKDTKDYIFLMNSKIDFVKETIDINPFSSNYFCWFDFSLPHVFKEPDITVEKFKSIAEQKYIENFLTIPGCWNNKIHDILFIKRGIVWRFSGGFFMGDKESLTEFYNISYDSFKEFLQETNTIVWEVNYWAWLESKKNLNVIWYYGSHDDTIIDVPENVKL